MACTSVESFDRIAVEGKRSKIEVVGRVLLVDLEKRELLVETDRGASHTVPADAVDRRYLPGQRTTVVLDNRHPTLQHDGVADR